MYSFRIKPTQIQQLSTKIKTNMLKKLQGFSCKEKHVTKFLNTTFFCHNEHKNTQNKTQKQAFEGFQLCYSKNKEFSKT